MGNGKKKKNETFEGLSPATKIKLLAEQLEAQQSTGPITVYQEPAYCPKCSGTEQLTVLEKLWACLECGSSGPVVTPVSTQVDELPLPTPAAVAATTATSDEELPGPPVSMGSLPGPPDPPSDLPGPPTSAPLYSMSLASLDEDIDTLTLPPNTVISYANGGVDTDPVVATITTNTDGFLVSFTPATSPEQQYVQVAAWDQAIGAVQTHLEHCPGCGQFISPMVAHSCPMKTPTAVAVANAVGAMNSLSMATTINDYEDSQEMYKATAELVEEAKQAMAANDASPEEVAAYTKELAKAQLDVLQAIPEEHLQQLANENGIAHPLLISPESTAFYLQTAYWGQDEDGEPVPSIKQAKVAAAADTRYATLQAGGEVNGMTLQSYLEQANASLVPSAAATTADPAPAPAASYLSGQEVEELITRSQEIREYLKTKSYQDPPSDEERERLLRELIVTQARLSGEVEDGYASKAVKEASDIRFSRYQLLPYGDEDKNAAMIDSARTAALEELGVDPAHGQFWSRREVLDTQMASALAKPEEFAAISHDRAEKIEAYKANMLTAMPYTTPEEQKWSWAYGDVDMKALDQGVADGSTTYAQFFQAQHGILERDKNLTSNDVPVVAEFHTTLTPEGTKQLKSNFINPHTSNPLVKEWAKEQSLDDLRAIATEVGLQNADAANRSQVTGYLAAHVAPTGNDVDAWQESINNAALKKATKSAAVAAAKANGTSAAASQSGFGANFKVGSGKSKIEPGAPMSFPEHAKYAAAAAQHMHASTEPIPARMSSAEVGAVNFTPAPNPGLGGMHSKDFYNDNDGRTWMAKRYKSATGGASARCATEAAASSLMGRAVPTVPVYEHSVGGAPAAMQPLIEHAGPISTDPSTYSQADVDSLVRMHVATWMVGDHDLHSGNVLRTKGGGLVPIDHGQAFKHYGSDKLSTDYHPNKQYGETPPVWQGLYKAAQEGQLASGVRVRPVAAAQAIDAFESIPDAEYRTMLEPVATAGAASESTFWRKTMRDKAAKRHKVAKGEVTNDQIADEFISHALERKKNLRSDFAKFFVHEGWVEAKEALAP